ncbi:uncharacterized protein LOC109724568 isoform X1 [Ananas comosus]|uniref:Uncharacterized protein LOC109724568 isoform X1 n=1 Tax=Ananas comosus TaxID=4615 RepID=A0A6P5GU54_ANACO|nr:uncharacterized protein LOC109724568 isoform X1 [Ananas comosus]XP_020109015.1 uncharacterized protein LOC109724568 isoform X1 [Ananas comosus]
MEQTNGLDVPNSSSAASCFERKRTRGKTIGLKWVKKRKEEKTKPGVEMPKDLQRAVGTNAQQFITETAQIVRQHAPLNVEKWSKIPLHSIDRMVKTVHEKFTLPNQTYVLGVIIHQLRSHFNSWRYDLHRFHYKKYKTDEQRRAHCPSDIDPDQWNWLINYWSDPKFKKMSEVNKENRSKQTMLARVGTKSIARNLTEMRKDLEENEQENNEISEQPEYMRLWEKVRKKKDGTWVDTNAKEKYKEMENLHTTQMQEKGEDILTTREAYTIVLGHRSRYVRGMGPGPEPLENGGLRGQRLRAQIQAEIEVEMTARIQEEVEARMAQKESEVQARIEQREAEAEARLAQKEARLEQMEAQMRAVMQHLSKIGMPLSSQPTSASR